MTTQIPVGPELDAAVAKACGWTPKVMDAGFGKGVHCVLTDESIPKGLWNLGFFEPSTNLNAAFEAAEKAGLFRRYSLGQCDDGWHVYLWDSMPYTDLSLAVCATPAEAICRAIVSLKGTT